MTADHFAKRKYIEDQVRLYQAGVAGDSTNARLLIDKSITDLLSSFAAPQSRRAAEYLASLTEEDRMKLFVAGNWGSELQEEVCDLTEERNLLCTNAHKGAQQCADHFAKNRFEYHLLIDSGAFTAFKQGTPIVLADYIAYAQGMLEKALCPIEFIGLDVITPHGASKEVLEQNCLQGYKNWQEMKLSGVPCIPTFHRGDNIEWLDKFARELPHGSRFCIAPKVDGTRVDVKINWLNQVFRRLNELNAELNAAQGLSLELWERWLIHGLGISSQEVMELYPWYSVDSTGWLWAAQNCTLRYFDDKLKKIQCIQSNEYMSGAFVLSEKAQQAKDHYQYSKNHEFVGVPLLSDNCNVCDKPFEEHGKTRNKEEDEVSGLDGGAYWFGKEAIRADVDLANHVTALWQSRGVYLPGEEKPEGFKRSPGDWEKYEDAEVRSGQQRHTE